MLSHHNSLKSTRGDAAVILLPGKQLPGQAEQAGALLPGCALHHHHLPVRVLRHKNYYLDASRTNVNRVTTTTTSAMQDTIHPYTWSKKKVRSQWHLLIKTGGPVHITRHVDD